MKNKIIAVLSFGFIILASTVFADKVAWSGPSAKEAYSKPNLHSSKELYRMAREAMASGYLIEARLFALRLFFDGNRSQNLLNLLGVIEIQNNRPLLASEWFRRANSVTLTNKVAQRYLSRLPSKPRPIPVDPTKLAEHFNGITEALPRLNERLVNEKLHFGSILKAIERGQFYLSLALAEEYEKKYKGDGNGQALTALCAWYLGRNKDALNIVESQLQNYPHHDLLLFTKAMVLDSHPATSSVSYFRALYDLDQWKKVRSLSQKYSKMNPNSPDAYITIARIMLDLHKIKEAGQALQEAGIRDPGNPETDLLWVTYLLQRKELDKASNRLQRAFRRGYNMPSVSLTAGLLAVNGGRLNEVNIILGDAINSRPFTDPSVYPIYITLLLQADRMTEARDALDEWKSRVSELSMLCYLEAFYGFKLGDNSVAIEWVRKGFKKNPDRLEILQTLIGFPALGDDPELFAMINNRLAIASLGDFSPISVPEPLLVSKPTTTKKDKTRSSGSGISGEGKFQITLGSGIDATGREILGSELASMYERIAGRIGTLSVPIFINFISGEGLGPTIAMYEPTNTVVTVTTVYYDSDMIRNIILANFDAFGDEEMGKILGEYPEHILAAELTRLIIQILIPESKINKNATAWMQRGLSEILAASNITQRYRLLVAQKSIEAGTASLASGNMINSIFAEGYTSPAVYETATAQSYLMTAFLIKRSGSLEKGCRQMMKIIELVSKGIDFSKALKETFNISEEEFEKGWKESAHWSLSQGTPYEWQ